MTPQDLARAVLSETLHWPVPPETLVALAKAVLDLTAEREELRAALAPLAGAQMAQGTGYMIGSRFGAPYDRRAAEQMVARARAALGEKP